jgi:hypothetical protein
MGSDGFGCIFTLKVWLSLVSAHSLDAVPAKVPFLRFCYGTELSKPFPSIALLLLPLLQPR